MDIQQTAQVYTADIRLLTRKRETLISEIARLRKQHADVKTDVERIQRQKVNLLHNVRTQAGELQKGIELTGKVEKEMDTFAQQTASDAGAKIRMREEAVAQRELAAKGAEVTLSLREGQLKRQEQAIKARDSEVTQREATTASKAATVAKVQEELEARMKTAGEELREANRKRDKAQADERAAVKSVAALAEQKGKLYIDIAKLKQELKDNAAAMRRSALAIAAREEAITKKETDLIARERKLVDREGTVARTIQRLRAKGYTGVI